MGGNGGREGRREDKITELSPKFQSFTFLPTSSIYITFLMNKNASKLFAFTGNKLKF